MFLERWNNHKKCFQYLTTLFISIEDGIEKYMYKKYYGFLMQDGLNCFFSYIKKPIVKIKFLAYFCNPLIKQTLKTLSNGGNTFCGIPLLYINIPCPLSTVYLTSQLRLILLKVFSAHCTALAIISDCNRHQIFHIFCNCNHKQSILFRAVGTWGPIASPRPPHPILAET